MPGPEFVCGAVTPSAMPETGTFDAAFNASTTNDDNFVFVLQWVANGMDPFGGSGHKSFYNSMNCTVYYSEYTFFMNYTGGVQSTNVSKTTGHILNSTSLVRDALYPNCGNSDCPPKDFPDDLTMLYSGQNVSTIYRESNVRAVYESLASALSGTVTGFG